MELNWLSGTPSSIWWAVGEVFHVQALCLRFPFVEWKELVRSEWLCINWLCAWLATVYISPAVSGKTGFIVRVASGVAWSLLWQWWFDVGRIKLFGAPRQWKHFRPLFQAVFFFSGGGVLPPRQSNTTPSSPKTEITNILFYILNFASIIKFKM